MPSMSYCRFQNTEVDLEGCVESLENQQPISGAERDAAFRMVSLAQRFLNAYGNYSPSEEEDEDE